MKLDPRILEGKKPLTAFDLMESKFIGTDCYFSDNARDYGDLSNCQIGTLLSRDGMTGVFNATKNHSYAFFEYCLPCEWVQGQEQEQKKKFRPYTLTEFLEMFPIGSVIKFREKGKEGCDRCLIFNGYRHERCKGQTIITDIYLGSYPYTLDELFNEYERQQRFTEEFEPFGVGVKE